MSSLARLLPALIVAIVALPAEAQSPTRVMFLPIADNPLTQDFEPPERTRDPHGRRPRRAH